MFIIGIEIQHNVKLVRFVRAYNNIIVCVVKDDMSQGWFIKSKADNDVFGDKRYIQ